MASSIYKLCYSYSQKDITKFNEILTTVKMKVLFLFSNFVANDKDLKKKES